MNKVNVKVKIRYFFIMSHCQHSHLESVTCSNPGARASFYNFVTLQLHTRSIMLCHRLTHLQHSPSHNTHLTKGISTFVF